MDGLGRDLSGQLTLVARTLARAVGDGVCLCGGEGLGDAASWLRRRLGDGGIVASWAEGGVAGDDLGGYLAVGALGDGGRARSDGVHGGGGECGGDGRGLLSSLLGGGDDGSGSCGSGRRTASLGASHGRAVGVVSRGESVLARNAGARTLGRG